MNEPLRDRAARALEGSTAVARLDRSAGPFFERRGDDEAAHHIEGKALAGLARLLATQPEMSGFLSYRPALLERIADSGPDTLGTRARDAEEVDEARLARRSTRTRMRRAQASLSGISRR